MCKTFVLGNIRLPGAAWVRLSTMSRTVLASALMCTPMHGQAIDLPTSKQILAPAPGAPQRVNSLPMTLAVSPDGKWVASLNAGYATEPSHYMQSIALLDTATGKVRDVPEVRTRVGDQQTFFGGLVFGANGTKLYASMASSSDPEGNGDTRMGNGVVVYAVRDGGLHAEGFLKLGMVPLAAGRHTEYTLGRESSQGIPYPAALALVPGRAHETLLVAENLSDSVAVMNAATGEVEKRFDLSSGSVVPSTYPIALAVSRDGARAFVALWNASEVVELDLRKGVVARRVALLKPASPTAPGTHPCSLLLDERTGLLYVALSNRDAVAAVRVGASAKPELAVRGYFDTRLPGQNYFGAEPDALAENADGTRVYAANMGSDAVAVLDATKLRGARKASAMLEPMGFVPTELMPVALASSGGKLYVATDKGKGTGPNEKRQLMLSATAPKGRWREYTYAPTLLFGSLATVDEAGVEKDLRASTDVVLESNRMKAAQETIAFAGGRNPIKHVIYIFKENRTYDQLLGDLEVKGQRVGNGDPKLTMYGEGITPNQHKLALQFGVVDNFYDSGEVSGSGHTWSFAAIGTDYLEKTWQQNYRSTERTYDYEGVVANGYPMLQHIPDVNEPASRYLWTNLAAHHVSLLHFGEYISSVFCTDKALPKLPQNPQVGAMSGSTTACAAASIAPGAAIPEEWGGGTNAWPWAIPRLAHNIATKPELVGHFVPEMPDFNLHIPDQVRVNIFLRHLDEWKRERASGKDAMPAFVLLRLPDDHTAGTAAGGPSPRSSIADNDLAVGRAVEAVSHSAYWDDTAIFVIEDDAQNGGDHVDAHRSLALVISKYSPHAPAGKGAFVDSRFYTTVSMIRTMEMLLGVPPMNNNDAFSSVMAPLFSGTGDQPAFTADYRNRDNRLIYEANKPTAPGAAESSHMDFSHADRADAAKLNVILWHDAMGAQPVPAMLREKHRERKDDDD